MASHQTLAEGMKKTLEFIAGPQDCCDTLCAFMPQTLDLERVVKSYMDQMKEGDERIVITDLFGGSVNNEFMKYIGKEGFILIAGMSLPLVMEIVLNMDKDLENQVNDAIQNARVAKNCNELFKNVSDEMIPNEGI